MPPAEAMALAARPEQRPRARPPRRDGLRHRRRSGLRALADRPHGGPRARPRRRRELLDDHRRRPRLRRPRDRRARGLSGRPDRQPGRRERRPGPGRGPALARSRADPAMVAARRQPLRAPARATCSAVRSTPEACQHALTAGFQRQRRAAAFELALARPEAPLLQLAPDGAGRGKRSYTARADRSCHRVHDPFRLPERQPIGASKRITSFWPTDHRTRRRLAIRRTSLRRPWQACTAPGRHRGSAHQGAHRRRRNDLAPSNRRRQRSPTGSASLEVGAISVNRSCAPIWRPRADPE